MEIYKGTGITFYIIDGKVYFKTSLQTMQIVYPNKKKTFSIHMRLVVSKIRSGEVDSIRKLYVLLNDKVNCESARLVL